MLYELRRYDVVAGKLPALIVRSGRFTVHNWQEHGIRLVGCWTPLLGEKSNQVVYIWGWESFEERTKKMTAWRASPERARKWEETEKDGPLVKRVYNQLMEGTSYCQLDKGEPYGPDASGRNPYLFDLREYQAMPGKITNIVERFGTFIGEVMGDGTEEADIKRFTAAIEYWMRHDSERNAAAQTRYTLVVAE